MISWRGEPRLSDVRQRGGTCVLAVFDRDGAFVCYRPVVCKGPDSVYSPRGTEVRMRPLVPKKEDRKDGEEEGRGGED